MASTNTNSSSGRVDLNSAANSVVYVAELETVLNLHSFENLGRCLGYFQIKISPSKTKDTNIYASTVFLSNRMGYHQNLPKTNIDEAASDVIHMASASDKVSLNQHLYLNTTIVLSPKDFLQFINNDCSFALNFELFGNDSISDPKLMYRLATCTVRVSCMRHKYCSFTNFVFFPLGNASILSVTSHTSLVKFYTLSRVADCNEIQGPLVPNTSNTHNIKVDNIARLHIFKLLLYSLNSIIFSYDAFIVPDNLSETDKETNVDYLIIKDFVGLSKQYSKILLQLNNKLSEGALVTQKIEHLIEEIPIKIYTLWAKYINRINNHASSIFKISLISRQIYRDYFASTLFTTQTHLNTDMLRYNENKKFFKQLKESRIFDHLFWTPFHQTSSDFIMNYVSNQGQVVDKNPFPTITFNLKTPPVTTILIEEQCTYNSTYSSNNLTITKTIDNTNNKIYKRPKELKSKIKSLSCYMNSSQHKLNRLSSLSNDEIQNQPSQYRVLTSKNSTFFAFLNNNTLPTDLNYEFYRKWFRSLYSVKHGADFDLVNQIQTSTLVDTKELEDISSIKNTEFINSMKKIMTSAMMPSKYSLAKFDTDRFKKDESYLVNHEKPHLIIFIHGLGGCSNDLDSYKFALKMLCKDQYYFMPRSNTDHDLPIQDQASIIMDEISDYLNHLHQIERISFISYSLGNLITRAIIEMEEFKPHVSKLHTFLSISGPHLGILFNSKLYSFGTWVLKIISKTKCLSQLELKETNNPKDSFVYKLSLQKNLSKFKNFVIVSSSQDQMVPYCSQRIEMCKEAFEKRDPGSIYQGMLENIMTQLIANNVNICKYDVCYSTHEIKKWHSKFMPGKAAHVAVLEFSFVQRLMTLGCVKYFD